MDAQALCQEIIKAEMSFGGDPWASLSSDAYTELMIAMEQTLLHEMRSDVASLGAHSGLVLTRAEPNPRVSLTRGLA